MNQTITTMIRRQQDWEIYKRAFKLSMQIFELSKLFPPEERFSITSQIRRASRSVPSNLAEAWRKRRYEAAFVSKLNVAEGEAAETQHWLDTAAGCDYIDGAVALDLSKEYDQVLASIVRTINNPRPWLLPRAKIASRRQ